MIRNAGTWHHVVYLTVTVTYWTNEITFLYSTNIWSNIEKNLADIKINLKQRHRECECKETKWKLRVAVKWNQYTQCKSKASWNERPAKNAIVYI